MDSLNVYEIYDSKAEAFHRPFFLANHNVAIRAFSAAAQDPQSEYGRFSADFTLFHIGSWSPHTGEWTPAEHKTNLGTALELSNIKELAK